MASPATLSRVDSAVAWEAFQGLTATPKTLSPWLFYDEAGSHLFEQITELPEYYLTRTERGLFTAHAEEMLADAERGQRLTLVELGAGTATKTGILLASAVRRQGGMVYQPIDVSETALDEARENIESNIPGVTVRAQVANYISEPLRLKHAPNSWTLALYIGSSIGNFTPQQAREILQNLRGQLRPGDGLLLGTDLVKEERTLLAAYDDAAGVTAAFNRNILVRLNQELGANFRLEHFRHRAVWNAAESRIEMHLVSTVAQSVRIPANADLPALTVRFEPGETIHTENSYKFTTPMIESLLGDSGFAVMKMWNDSENIFAVTLAEAV